MKTRLSFCLLLLFLSACILGHPMVALSQDAEKQKIIDVITGELDAWYKKDREKWINSLAHSSDLLLTAASPSEYYSVLGFDNLVAPREKHFTTPPDPKVKRITKTDFKVNIKGTIAIVDLTQGGEDVNGPYKSDQTILMEKQGKSWKILRQTSVAKSAYALNDKNIEAGINTQGYKFMQLKKYDEAIKVFTLNTQLFPNAWNTWDSLAEAFMKKGETQIAIGFYNKSLQLNPDNDYAKEMVEKMSKEH